MPDPASPWRGIISNLVTHSKTPQPNKAHPAVVHSDSSTLADVFVMSPIESGSFRRPGHIV